MTHPMNTGYPQVAMGAELCDTPGRVAAPVPWKGWTRPYLYKALVNCASSGVLTCSWRGISQGFGKSAQSKELVAADLFSLIPLMTWRSVPASRWALCPELTQLHNVCAQWGSSLYALMYTQLWP